MFLYCLCWSLIGALCAVNLIDSQGRKKLLIGSYLGMVRDTERFSSLILVSNPSSISNTKELIYFSNENLWANIFMTLPINWSLRIRFILFHITLTLILAKNLRDPSITLGWIIFWLCFIIVINFAALQAASMFVVIYAITWPLDEEVSHSLSILGTLTYVFSSTA